MVDSVPLEVPEETPTLCIPRSLQVKENQHFEDQHNCPLQAGQRVCDTVTWKQDRWVASWSIA